MIGLEDLCKIKGGDKKFIRYLKRINLEIEEDYPEFISVLYADLDDISYNFNKNPQRRAEDTEDRLTDEIVSALNLLGYTADHDRESGGHVDVTVELGSHSWIGEAKIHQGPAYLYEGFLQLATRYRPASGNWKHNHGGMLIYIQKQKNAAKLKQEWKDHLACKFVEQGEAIEFADCKNNIFAFNSTHNHEISGLEFIVRHIPFLLTHEPKDKSGRNRKPRKPRATSKKTT